MKKMIKKNDNLRAIVLWVKLCPLYFPVLIMQTFFSVLSPYYNIYLSAELVDIITTSMDWQKIKILVLSITFGNLAIAIIGALLGRAFSHIEFVLDQKEARYCNQKTLNLDYSDLENTEVRQLRRKITESSKINGYGKRLLITNIKRVVQLSINLFLSGLLCAEMLAMVIGHGISWKLLVFLFSIILSIIVNVYLNFNTSKRLSDFSQKVTQTMIDENRIDGAVDSYNMGKDVRIYNQSKIIMHIKKKSLKMHEEAFKSQAILKFKYRIPMSIIKTLLNILVYSFIAIYALMGVFSIGSVLKYAGIIRGIIEAIIGLFDVYGQTKNNRKYIQDYLRYYEIKSQMHKQGALSCEKAKENFVFEFKNVSFKYPNTDTYVLRNISCKLYSGGKISIVGENGSGKTTFVKLLCRLYDPDEGEIFLNGINIKEYDYDEYLSWFAIVFQDFKLFSFELGQNVAVSEKYDSQDVQQCLVDVGFYERYDKMEKKLQTFLYKDFDNNGVEISGGEAQKIALARALYKKESRVVILDEPTAAMDPIAEHEIYCNFDKIVKGKTAIYITHRLSSCRFSDRVIVFDNGRITEIGTHNELVSLESGKYYELWNSQAQYYQ